MIETPINGLTVVLVGPVPPPHGGMANQAAQLRRLLSESGATVSFVATNATPWPRILSSVPIVRGVWRLPPYWLRLWRACGPNRILHLLASSGLSWHLWAAPAIRIGRLRGAAVVVNYRGGGAAAFLARSRRFVLPTMRLADALVVPSPFLERIFRAEGLVPRVVPNVVDSSRFHPEVGTSEPKPGSSPPPGGSTREPVILVARNLEPIYDIGTALRAFARVRDHISGSQLLVAGSGPERESLGALAKALGIAEAVLFLGKVPNEEMPGIYRRAALTLNPSRADNMPISILESLASGVPVVSTSVGGIPDLVADGKTALLVEAGDDRSMAEAAIRALTDSDLHDSLAREGEALAKEFEWLRVRERLAVVYGDALRAAAERRSRRAGRHRDPGAEDPPRTR